MCKNNEKGFRPSPQKRGFNQPLFVFFVMGENLPYLQISTSQQFIQTY